MRYFKSRKQDEKADLEAGSIFLHQISRPSAVNANDITRSRYPVNKHPTLDEYYMLVDGDIPVHVNVKDNSQDGETFTELDNYTSNNGETLRMKALFKTKNRVYGHEVIPKRWDEKTLTELQNEGYFQEAQ